MPLELKISSDNDGRRVDRVLRVIFRDVPLGAIMKAVREGAVRLDGKKTRPDERVEAGQILSVPWDSNSQKKKTVPSRGVLPLPDTIYRDEYLWVVNKPAGLLTQPNVKGGDSLITRVLAALEWSRSDFAPAAVSRLDAGTSGVVAVAMSGEALRVTTELIRERAIRKIYRAIVEGTAPESGRIEIPLLKDRESNTVKADSSGRAALTIYRRVAVFGNVSEVEAELVTGRPHQARVHFSAIGHSVAGDVKYGAKKAGRPLLHAYKIILPRDARLPEKLRAAEFTAPLPPDMARYEKSRDMVE